MVPFRLPKFSPAAGSDASPRELLQWSQPPADSRVPIPSHLRHNTPHAPASYGRVRMPRAASRGGRARLQVPGPRGPPQSESAGPSPARPRWPGRHSRAAWATPSRVRRSELPLATSSLRHVLASQLELEPLAPGHRRAALLAAAGQGRQGCPRLGARHFGRGASPVYVAPVSESLATIPGNLTDDRRIGAGSSGHLREGRSRGQVLTSMRRGACESTPASRSARITVVASPLASQPGLRAVRHALCCVASHCCIGPAPSSGSASKTTCPKSHSWAMG